jgi:hypothetical protein
MFPICLEIVVISGVIEKFRASHVLPWNYSTTTAAARFQ